MEAIVHPDGRFVFAGQTYRCALGRAGVSTHKLEGDHATPAGVMPLRQVLYRADRVPTPRCAVPCEPISPDDGWCDESRHPAYNTRIRLPFPARHEFLWHEDNIYDVVGVLGWNETPIRPGRGSAIFLHVARLDLSPTAGCVALPVDTLLKVLADGLTSVNVLES
jgi:L,D-peptidoglycan transpeptidase YkuD (ErfK/YbiS/YcfS/YnhG family)